MRVSTADSKLNELFLNLLFSQKFIETFSVFSFVCSKLNRGKMSSVMVCVTKTMHQKHILSKM